jgi:hypothetical protein
VVEDARDIGRAGKLLFARLWDAGYGYIQLSKAGSMLVRSLVDSAVWQPERLDFVAGAVCDKPLEQRRGDPVLYEGARDALDTKAALPDDKQLWARYEAAVEDAKAEKRGESERVRADYRADRIARGDGDAAAIDAAIDSHRLPETWTVYLDDGSPVKVGDILQKPDDYNGSKTLDPLEPDYDHGRAVGKIYANGRAPTIWSYARGGRTFYLGAATAWMGRLRTNDQGLVLKDHANVLIALREAPELSGLFAWNEFTGKVELLRPVPEWGKAAPKADHNYPRLRTDADDVAVVIWLQSACMPGVAEGTVGGVIRAVAEENSYHPVRDYLDALRWDGQDRLSTWLIDYLGAEDTAYTRAVGRAWLISAVARVMKPGAKVDHMLVIEGEQGITKSSVFEVLAGEWFDDSMPRDVGHKDSMEHLKGKWIVEMAELSSVKYNEVEELKSFLTKRIDRYRPSYGRNEIEWARQCVFAGTTNESTYLKDHTGNRRFWPVACPWVDLEGLRRWRDQLWAQAVVAYRNGERWWLDKETEELAREAQDARRPEDPWEPAVLHYLRQRQGDSVTTAEVAVGALGMDEKDLHNGLTQRLGKMLRNFGCERRRPGGKVWRYVVPELPEVTSLDEKRRQRETEARM